jgi:hypothetical protein
MSVVGNAVTVYVCVIRPSSLFKCSLYDNHCGDVGVDGWIILGCISRRWDVGIWTGLDWPRIETGGECL